MLNIERLVAIYNLNQTDQAILLFLDTHQSELKKIGIRDVAHACYTSTTTIMNVAKKMHFSGYSELVFRIMEANTQPQTIDDASLTASSIQQFCQLVAKHQQDLITIVGSGFSQNIANYMNDTLNFHFIRSITTPFLELIKETSAHQQNLLLFVSHSGEEKKLNELAAEAAQCQVDIISFVGSKQSTLAQLSTLTISTDSYSPFSSKSAKPQVFFGKTLIQFEILISQFLNQQKEKSNGSIIAKK